MLTSSNNEASQKEQSINRKEQQCCWAGIFHFNFTINTINCLNVSSLLSDCLVAPQHPHTPYRPSRKKEKKHLFNASLTASIVNVSWWWWIEMCIVSEWVCKQFQSLFFFIFFSISYFFLAFSLPYCVELWNFFGTPMKSTSVEAGAAEIRQRREKDASRRDLSGG